MFEEVRSIFENWNEDERKRALFILNILKEVWEDRAKIRIEKEEQAEKLRKEDEIYLANCEKKYSKKRNNTAEVRV